MATLRAETSDERVTRFRWYVKQLQRDHPELTLREALETAVDDYLERLRGTYGEPPESIDEAPVRLRRGRRLRHG